MAAAPAKTTSTLRRFAGALAAAARQVSRPKFVAIVAGITVLAVVAIFVPVPSAVQLRDWAESVGPWFPLAFLLAHIVVTVVPVPRTAFTLAAGLLFGPVAGVVIAVAASAASAVLAVLLVRAAGCSWIAWSSTGRSRRWTSGCAIEAGRAVLSLRLIPRCAVCGAELCRGCLRRAVAALHAGHAQRYLSSATPAPWSSSATRCAGHVSPMFYLSTVYTGALACGAVPGDPPLPAAAAHVTARRNRHRDGRAGGFDRYLSRYRQPPRWRAP